MQITVKLTNTQYNFLQDNRQYTCFTGGYKSGKTFIFVRKAIKTLTETRQDGLLAEPNYRMNEDLLRPELEKTFTQFGIKYKWLASDSIYQTKYGKILLRTQDKRSSLEGHNLGWFGFDEADLIQADKAVENWRAIISKLTQGERQYGFLTGTNEGFEFIYDKFYKDASYNTELSCYDKGTDYRLYQGSTYENAVNLPDGYLDRLINDYADQRLIDRYIHGQFTMLTGLRAAYNYTEENFADYEYNPSAETFLCWDFNVDPMTCLVNQRIDNDRFCYVAEFIINESNTEETATKAREFIGDKHVIVTGDYSGNRRETSSSRSDYEIIKSIINCEVIKRPTISIRDRLNAMNRGFKIKRQFVNIKNCPRLHEDLLRTNLKNSGLGLDSQNGKRGHHLDALSYFDYNFYPIQHKREYY